MAARIDREDLDADADSVLVLRNAGPLGGPGMPEWGMLPVPKKLLKQGVRDMVRISDARMSGTSYGCCVLHVAPESFVGGPLAFVRAGDLIELDVDADSVLILRNAGPLGGPGMPEWGMLPIPKKLLAAGVRDMVRISDARMSGTSYGTCVLHVAPESFVGGPLALVKTGDIVKLDVAGRRLDLDVSEDELARRKAAWKAPQAKYPRGYGAIFSGHVKQADEGCDFDFLEGTAPVPEPEIH
jgi:dihydroxyacid dehydratase/phosphogluconate dehydratase